MDNSALKLDNQLCFRIYTASRLMIRLYKPLLDKLNLTYPQYVTMLVMWEAQAIGFKDLGEKLHMQTGTLTPVVQRLEKSGYLLKEKDPKDDRRAIVKLTPKGEELVNEARQIPRDLAKALDMTYDEFLEYRAMLDSLIGKLNNAEL